ncbi:MAG TPA: histidine phosphatase family protein [Jatrophihabitans sp.]|nr:histidine phosphatase family protein [Jatrophihabitans sp.]
MTADNNNSTWLASGATPTRFILLRHGVTAYSVQRRFAGRSDLPLLDEGIAQARAAARRTSELTPIDGVISSPLRRTRQTAAAVAEQLGLPVALDEGLIETDFGSWDGYTFDELRQADPELLASWLADPEVAPPGGESQLQVSARVLAARDRLVKAHPGRTLVLVTHVSPIKVLAADVLGAPASAVHRMYLAPASVSVLDYFPDGPMSLRCFNDTAHLPGG